MRRDTHGKRIILPGHTHPGNIRISILNFAHFVSAELALSVFVLWFRLSVCSRGPGHEGVLTDS